MDGIIFVDRVSSYPNRYMVTPVNGDPSYQVMLERADNPTVEGTPLNAATFNNLLAEFGKNEYAWLTDEWHKSHNKWSHGDVVFSVKEEDGSYAASQRYLVSVVAGETYFFTWNCNHSNMPDVDSSGAETEMGNAGWARIYNATAWNSDNPEEFPSICECGSGATFVAPGDYILIEFLGSYSVPTSNTATYSNIMLVGGMGEIPYQPYGGGDLVRGGKLERFKSVWYATRDKSLTVEKFAQDVLLQEAKGCKGEWVAATLDFRGSPRMMWGYATNDGQYGKMFLVGYDNPLKMFDLFAGNWSETEISTRKRKLLATNPTEVWESTYRVLHTDTNSLDGRTFEIVTPYGTHQLTPRNSTGKIVVPTTIIGGGTRDIVGGFEIRSYAPMEPSVLKSAFEAGEYDGTTYRLMANDVGSSTSSGETSAKDMYIEVWEILDE